MWKYLNRFASIGVATAQVVCRYQSAGGEDAYMLGFTLLFPILIIWFSKPLGEATGYFVTRWDFGWIPISKTNRVDTQTHPGILVFVGWVALLSPIWGPMLWAWFSKPVLLP